MICGGRAYKGENLEVVIPFSDEGYDNFTISFYTTGDYKITKTADEVEIVDGEVIYTFTKEELDVLPDGVLRYSIDYEKDGTEYVQSSNTSVVVKTPAGYSATSMSDVIASATTEGYESGYGEGKEVGYESGYTAGQADCPECSGSCQLQHKTYSLIATGDGSWSVQPDDGYDGMASLAIYDDAGYGEGKYNQGIQYQKSLLSAITISENGFFHRADGYSSVNVKVVHGMASNADFGIGFYGPAEVSIHEDSNWDRYDVETKLGYYITTVINPEEGFSYEFDEMDMRQSWSRTYGEGYHTIWFELNHDIPTNMNWMSIQSGGTYGNLNLILPYTGMDINSFFPNNTYTEINFSNPNTDEEQLLMNLFLY